MGKKITDIYKREFFEKFGATIAAARMQQKLYVEDLSEMTGYSVGKLESIERGTERRLLKMQLEGLLNMAYALNKKIVFNFEDLTSEETEKADLPTISDDVLLNLISARLK